MARRRRKSKPLYFVNIGLSLAVLAVFGMTGIRLAGASSAATTNPYGYADYCTLENNTTVIYGWASDPNASSLTQPAVTVSAGGKATTADTNRAGYRDAQINSWIDQNRGGDPKPGTYGFRAELAGLYKGNQYTLTGTALNEGPGSSVILTINTSGYTDGDSSKAYFAGNTIPQGCLANTATPPVQSTPTPTAPPKASGSSGSSGGNSTSNNASSSNTAGTTLSNAADGALQVGTLAAEIKVPAGNAAKVHVNYGKNPLQLDQNTPDRDVSGDTTTLLLAGLDPTAPYTYTIVRTASNGQSTTSAPATFNTLGFVLALHFVDNQNKGLQGIPANLSTQKTKKTSDNSGNVAFTNVPAGSYTVSYSYNNKTYSKQVTANGSLVSPAEAASAKVITIDTTINIQKASGAVQQTDKGTNLLGIIVPLTVGIIAVILAVIGFTRRRNRQRYQDYYEDFPAPPLPDYQSLSVPPEPTVPQPQHAAHMGESLKDMVLRSMAEEAKRREDTPHKK